MYHAVNKIKFVLEQRKGTSALSVALWFAALIEADVRTFCRRVQFFYSKLENKFELVLNHVETGNGLFQAVAIKPESCCCVKCNRKKLHF